MSAELANIESTVTELQADRDEFRTVELATVLPSTGLNDGRAGGWGDQYGAAGGGLALGSKVCFGHSISGAVVTIYSGYVLHGTRAAITVAQTNKTITIDHQYVWVEYVFGSGAASIAGPSVTMPISDATTYRSWLYLFRLITGVASLERVGHFGNVEIAGSFA